MYRLYFLTLVLSILLAGACSGPGSKGSTGDSSPQERVTGSGVSMSDDEFEAHIKAGRKIYIEKCLVCHMADGAGIPNAFPPVRYSDYLQADPVRGAEQVLNGSDEKMIVNGKVYDAPMPPQVNTKEEARAVINYVLYEMNGYKKSELLTTDDIDHVKIERKN